MNRLRSVVRPLAALLVLGGVSLSLTASVDGLAARPAAADTPAPAVPSLATKLDALKWGMTHQEVIKVYNQVNGVFDKEYNPMLAKMQPGTRMQAVEAERESRKLAFASSFIEFKDTPLGYDTTGLSGEYSYKNHEYILVLRRDWGRRFFFFIGSQPGERLWKVYDEAKAVDGSPYPKTYAETVSKMNAELSVNGRARGADAAKGFSAPFTEWADPSTHMRVVDRSGEGVVGVVLEDKATLSSLPQLRANKLEDPMAMDPAIARITSGGNSDPNSAQPKAGADAGARRH